MRNGQSQSLTRNVNKLPPRTPVGFLCIVEEGCVYMDTNFVYVYMFRKYIN